MKREDLIHFLAATGGATIKQLQLYHGDTISNIGQVVKTAELRKLVRKSAKGFASRGPATHLYTLTPRAQKMLYIPYKKQTIKALELCYMRSEFLAQNSYMIPIYDREFRAEILWENELNETQFSKYDPLICHDKNGDINFIFALMTHSTLMIRLNRTLGRMNAHYLTYKQGSKKSVASFEEWRDLMLKKRSREKWAEAYKSMGQDDPRRDQILTAIKKMAAAPSLSKCSLAADPDAQAWLHLLDERPYFEAINLE